jgi:cytochrome P450
VSSQPGTPDAVNHNVATPPSSASALSEQRWPAVAARLGAALAAAWGQPIRIGTKVIVARHGDVREVLARDLDFRIAPINDARIEAVNGPYVLGMDRGATLVRERGALYQALAKVDLAPLRATVAREAKARIAAAGDAIDVVNGYARPIAAHTARALFGVAGSDEPTFMDVARAIFAHIFLNISGEKEVESRALRAAALMHHWLAEEISRRRRDGNLGADMMGALLAGGILDDDGVRRTLGGMLVGSIDTTASSVAKIVIMIARDKT